MIRAGITDDSTTVALRFTAFLRRNAGMILFTEGFSQATRSSSMAPRGRQESSPLWPTAFSPANLGVVRRLGSSLATQTPCPKHLAALTPMCDIHLIEFGHMIKARLSERGGPHHWRLRPRYFESPMDDLEHPRGAWTQEVHTNVSLYHYRNCYSPSKHTRVTLTSTIRAGYGA